MLYSLFISEFNLKKPFEHKNNLEISLSESSKIIHRYAVMKNLLLLLFEKNNIVIF